MTYRRMCSAKKTPDIASSMISTYLGDHAGAISEKAFNSFRKEFNSKFELLAEVDRDTLYLMVLRILEMK